MWDIWAFCEHTYYPETLRNKTWIVLLLKSSLMRLQIRSSTYQGKLQFFGLRDLNSLANMFPNKRGISFYFLAILSKYIELFFIVSWSVHSRANRYCELGHRITKRASFKSRRVKKFPLKPMLQMYTDLGLQTPRNSKSWKSFAIWGFDVMTWISEHRNRDHLPSALQKPM